MRWTRVILVGSLAIAACGDSGGQLRFSRGESVTVLRDAAVARSDLELDLEFHGAGRTRIVSRVKGRDVRTLLPEKPLKVRRGSSVFAVVPVGRSWARVTWRAATVVSVGYNLATLRTAEGRLFHDVPQAMMIHSRPRRLPKPGEVVRVLSGRELPYGIVVASRPGRIQVRTTWLGQTRLVQAKPHEVLSVRDGLHPGSPVLYWFEATRRIGSLVTSARKHRWVLGAEGVMHRLSWTRVSPVIISRRHKRGDQVLAALPISLKLVTVIRRLPGDVLYEVAWEQTRRAVLSFASLTSP